MKKILKSVARKIFITLRIPITKNIEYDLLTARIMQRALAPDSNCIDVGAHKGEILDLILKLAPRGKHLAFEPIPEFHNLLNSKYGSRLSIYPYALSDYEGTTEFNLVVDDPAYSGLKKRTYRKSEVTIQKIDVQVRMLDHLLDTIPQKINLIKIDVEGGEFDVLKGAKKLLKRDKPLIIFECGKGASEFYGTKPEGIFEFLSDLNYSVFTLKNFMSSTAYDKTQFVSTFEEGKDYYFISCASL